MDENREQQNIEIAEPETKESRLSSFQKVMGKIGKGIVLALGLLYIVIYGVGYWVEGLLVKVVKLCKKICAKDLFDGICALGAWVVDTIVAIGKGSVTFALAISRSFIKDFSYWAPSITAAFIVGFLIFSNFYTFAVKITVDDKLVGYVNNEGEYQSIVHQVEDSMGDIIGEAYVMSTVPQYSLSLVRQHDMTKEDDLYLDVYQIASEEIGEHFGLYVDGELVAAAEQEQTIQDVLQTLKAPYETGKENQRVEFVQEVEVRAGMYSADAMMNSEQLAALFKTDDNRPAFYRVQEGDYFSTIAKKLGMTTSQLKALNPDVKETQLYEGLKLNVSVPEVYLGVKVVETKTYTKSIDFSVKRISTNTLAKGTTKVKTAGVKGKKQVTTETTYIDGVKTKTETVDSVVIKEPVTKEIYVGTKKVASNGDGISRGTFRRPISGGYVSCAYGGYKGHKGVDLTMSGAYGKSVYAADGGKVIFSGWSGGYGNLIKIQHSNGYVTYYAHLSARLVSVGDKVSRGQTIGRIGSTGNSTGPHLHFEIRKNGVALNPMKYI